MGPTVYEAAEALIRENRAKIQELQDEIDAAQVRLRTQFYANMTEAERLAKDGANEHYRRLNREAGHGDYIDY